MNVFCWALVLAVVIGAADAVITNYCDKSLCKSSKHIACGHNDQFAASCPKDAALINIDDKLQLVMLDAFNELRNRMAGGDQPGFRPACRMGTMQWSDELAKLAELNVKQCKLGHDCHDTPTYRDSGQSIFWMGGYSGESDNVDYLQSCVRSWYSEVKYSNAADIKKISPGGPVTGHFLQIVIENNVRVGCAASEYTDDGSKSFLVACNFATLYTRGSTIYYDCDVPAGECKTGKNPKFPNLCSTSEKYHYDYNWPDKKN